MGMLQHGSKGREVRTLQQALVDLGYEIDVDGDFGDGTDEAVRAFQEENELDADGIVGEDTWNALGFEDLAKAAAVPTLQHGSKGTAVRTLQQALVDQGYEIDVDGDFGDGTDEAVRDFQEESDLDVDGIVGPSTWAALAR